MMFYTADRFSVSPQIFIFPAVFTIALHGILGFFLSSNWSLFSSEEWQVVAEPRVINARLVTMENTNLNTKPETQKKSPNTNPSPKTKHVIRERIVKPTLLNSSVQNQAVETEPDLEKVSKWSITQQAREDLMNLISSEEYSNIEENNVSISHANSIRRTIVSYWSRPPSARNGMECLLSIRLVPTGEVIDVSILRTSGDKAFDLSALNAVNKAGSFPELKDLPVIEFEKHFRQFRLLFRPEDLRY